MRDSKMNELASLYNQHRVNSHQLSLTFGRRDVITVRGIKNTWFSCQRLETGEVEWIVVLL